jgi:DNA-directed RNA polymerase subunit RPC12/RpoP
MEKDAITQKCARCGKQRRVLEMVMDASGKGMACRACVGLNPGAAKSAPKSAPVAEAREGYTCADCNYKFKSAKSPGIVVCGYCGSARVVSSRQSSADSILHQAGASRYEL